MNDEEGARGATAAMIAATRWRAEMPQLRGKLAVAAVAAAKLRVVRPRLHHLLHCRGMRAGARPRRAGNPLSSRASRPNNIRPTRQAIKRRYEQVCGGKRAFLSADVVSSPSDHGRFASTIPLHIFAHILHCMNLGTSPE